MLPSPRIPHGGDFNDSQRDSQESEEQDSRRFKVRKAVWLFAYHAYPFLHRLIRETSRFIVVSEEDGPAGDLRRP
jgi:hypothetical protein